jgi:glycosyltransferase involved in cell wall biosynthesis
MSRICTTAWHEIDSVAAAGAEIRVMAGDSVRLFPHPVRVETTLSRGRLRIPYRLLGTYRACVLHDWLVARRLPALAGKIDIIHAWPLGALRTIRVAKNLGIPVVLERCNTHTRFAYEVVRKECERIGVPLPPGHEHAFNVAVLEREEAEYNLADRLLCPSDFVAQTFVDRGFPAEKLLRHQYGFDDKVFYPDNRVRDDNRGLTVLFAGGCTPRKGLHYALDAWLQSTASAKGSFLIAGSFIPGYAERLSTQLAHPSVKVLGHRNDIPDLMRQSDILILPSIEEGSALVTAEARGCGCVLLVSDAAGAICRDGENALVHRVGDVEVLVEHLNRLQNDHHLLAKLRDASLRTVHEITWIAAGVKLVDGYHAVLLGRDIE